MLDLHFIPEPDMCTLVLVLVLEPDGFVELSFVLVKNANQVQSAVTRTRMCVGNLIVLLTIA